MINKLLIKQAKRDIFGSDRAQVSLASLEKLYKFNPAESSSKNISVPELELVEAMKCVPQEEWEHDGLGIQAIALNTIHALPFNEIDDRLGDLDAIGNTLASTFYATLQECAETLGEEVLRDMVDGNWDDMAHILGYDEEWRNEEITTDELESEWDGSVENIADENLPFSGDDFAKVIKWMRKAGKLDLLEIGELKLVVPKGSNFVLNNDAHSQAIDEELHNTLSGLLYDKTEETFGEKWNLDYQ